MLKASFFYVNCKGSPIELDIQYKKDEIRLYYITIGPLHAW